ncbi:MAG: tol-pal system protein YbgF [Desulfovibrionaceae bacterium]|nr:tol-pal system protein YbgF [Desulfovibrionaceae bacterium]
MSDMKRCLGALLAGSLALGGCVSQSQVDAMQMRINQQDQMIRTLHNQLSGVQPAQADTWAQVQTLRQEMSTVRGEIDNFNHASAPVGGLSGLARKVMQHDEALRNVGRRFDMDLGLDAEEASQGSGSTPAVAPAAPQSNTSEKTSARGAEETGQTVQPAAKKPDKKDASGDMAKALYDAGMASYNARNYSRAYTSFRDLTQTYPNSRYIANAWYQRGECSYQMGKYMDAALDFNQVITKYPKSGRAPSAYLKQGLAFQKAGKKQAAKQRFEELIQKYPKAPEAARAKQALKNL